MRKPRVAIGIDLGISKCCVGVVRDGKVEILENERGNKTTPSYVAFTDTERLVGEDAKEQATVNPTNTVFGVKRFIGRRFDDPAVQNLVPRLPYKLKESEQGKPFLELAYRKENKELYPEQVTAMLLTKMVEMVRKQTDCPVDEAVISVPASFSNAQRQATKDAAAIAGLKVLALINEPTAAAIAYEANRKGEEPETIAVVDLGGGKIEVSFVHIGKGSVEVMSVHGCNCMGGLDVDDDLVEILVNKFGLERRIDLKHNVKAKERLRNACEKLKHTLTLLPEARVQLDCLSGDIDFEATVTRKEFDQVLENNIIAIMNKLWRRIKLSINVEKLTVTRVLLVGGSTRIPLVQEWIKKTFGTSKLDKTINPDEAVAQGASIRAALLSGHCELPEIVVRDVIPNPLYLIFDNTKQVLFDTFANLFDNMVSPISAQSSKTQFGLLEEQSSFNGLRKLYLGQFHFPGKSFHSIEFCGRIDESGILVASFLLNDKKQRLDDLILDSLRLFSNDDLSKFIFQEDLFRKDVITENQRVMALSDLEAYCFQQKNDLKTLGKQGKVSQNRMRQLDEQIEEAISWVDNNPGASENTLNKKMLELQTICSSFSGKSKERSSPRSSSVGRSLKPASPSAGVIQERSSRLDQSRVGQDVHKTRSVSQSARGSGQGTSERVSRDNDFRGTNGLGASSRSLKRDPHVKGESPRMMRKSEDQSGGKSHARGESPQRPERSKGQTPKRPHSRDESSLRQPPPHSRGESHQDGARGPTAIKSESLNPHQFSGTGSNQQEGSLPYSSIIIKEFTENKLKRNESNSPIPSIKRPLLPAGSSRVPSASIPSGPDNMYPAHRLEARGSSKTPANGLMTQPGDQHRPSSLSSHISQQANITSASHHKTQDSADQIPSRTGGVTVHYSSVYQPTTSRNDVYHTGPLHQSTNVLSANHSPSISSRVTATGVSTPAPPLKSGTSSDICTSQRRQYDTRSIGVQTDPPSVDENATKPTKGRTCEVCCEMLRCGCTPANGPSENLGSISEQKGFGSDSVHQRSGSASKAVLTTVPSPQNSTSRAYLDGINERLTTLQVQTPGFNTAPPTTTSHLSRSPIKTRSTQLTYSSTSAVTASHTNSSPSPSSHDLSRNLRGRVNIPVSSMCSHGNRSDNCEYCFRKHSQGFREQVDSWRPGAEDRSDAGAGAACHCRGVSCSKCVSRLNSRAGFTSDGAEPTRGRGSVKERMKIFETSF